MNQLTKIQIAFYHQVLAKYIGNVTNDSSVEKDWLEDKQHIICAMWTAYSDNANKIAMIKTLREASVMTQTLYIGASYMEGLMPKLKDAVLDVTDPPKYGEGREFQFKKAMLGLKEAKDFCDFMVMTAN